jgi:hypothetical protein
MKDIFKVGGFKPFKKFPKFEDPRFLILYFCFTHSAKACFGEVPRGGPMIGDCPRLREYWVFFQTPFLSEIETVDIETGTLLLIFFPTHGNWHRRKLLQEGTVQIGIRAAKQKDRSRSSESKQSHPSIEEG